MGILEIKKKTNQNLREQDKKRGYQKARWKVT
jgi:hypothetical protein